jgi:hypothetical protein
MNTHRAARYYISARGIDTLVALFGGAAVLISTPLILSGSVMNLLFYFVPAILLLTILWLCLARGIYITIDDNGNLYNTFFFIKRDSISLSKIVSLSARHPLLLLGRGTQIWNTFYDAKGRLVTKTLVARETLKGSDFRNLIETIQTLNPKVQIAQELLD